MNTAEEKLLHAKELLHYYQYSSQNMQPGLRDMFLSKSAVIGMIFETLGLMTSQEWETFAGITQ